MESLIQHLFFQWQRKGVALLISLVVWILVNHSITSTKIIPSVPIRIVNLPVDKTIQGLQPNGFLAKRATLTLSGSKDIVEQLEPGDLEVVIDVSNQSNNEGIFQISKKNLLSLNPNINLSNHITSVTHPDLVIKLSEIQKEKIPVTILPPVGQAPEGYIYLDIWPIKLTHTVSGPQEQILELKNKGVELSFNLNELTKQQLDSLKNANSPYGDEVSFLVPDQWKKITIPSLNQPPEVINDPEAKNLRIDFLRQEWLPIKGDTHLHVFYPLKYSATLNPSTYVLAPNAFIHYKNDIPVLKQSLFTYSVSKLFLEIITGFLEINIVAAPKTEREHLEWSLGIVDEQRLEDLYVAFLLNNMKAHSANPTQKNQEREETFRKRFRLYRQMLKLYLSPEHLLDLESSLQNNEIVVQIPPAPPSTFETSKD